MQAESAEGLMDLKERTKQCALYVLRMYSVLPKNTEAQLIGRQVLCTWTSVDIHSHQGRSSHSGEPCGARHPDAPYMVPFLTRQPTAHQHTSPPV